MGCGCKKNKTSEKKPIPDRTAQIREKLRAFAQEKIKKNSK